MVIVLLLLGTLLSLGYASFAQTRRDNLRIRSVNQLRQIQAAKDAYVLDHLGEGSPAGLPDREAVFRSYFVEGSEDFSRCALTGQPLSGVYDVYVRTRAGGVAGGLQ